MLLPHEAEGVRSGWFDPAGSVGESSLWERLNTGSYQFSEPSGSRSGGVLQITPGATPEGDAPLMKLYSSENADWEVNFEVDGETVDIPFAWAWISSVTAPPAKATASDDRVLEALKDSAYMDFGWYFSERLGWIHVGSEYWPWVWSARSAGFIFSSTRYLRTVSGSLRREVTHSSTSTTSFLSGLIQRWMAGYRGIEKPND